VEEVLAKFAGNIGRLGTRAIRTTRRFGVAQCASQFLVQSNKGIDLRLRITANLGEWDGDFARGSRRRDQFFQTTSDYRSYRAPDRAFSREHTLPEAMADALRRVERGHFRWSWCRRTAYLRPAVIRAASGPLAMGRIPAAAGI